MARKIGIIGGGQLGLMIAEEAHRQGAAVYALDPDPDAPAFAETDGHIVAAYDDLAALERLGGMTDVLTYEFENVPGDVLKHLDCKYNIPQGIAPLFDSQDRLREKNNARRHGLPVPEYIPLPACSSDEDCAVVPGVPDQCLGGNCGADGGLRQMTDAERVSELTDAVRIIGMPCVLKTRRFGYDGHGQAVIRCEEDILKAADMLRVPCILEEFVKFDYECSVIMVRDAAGDIVHFPIGRNIHRNGILDLCLVPAEGMYLPGCVPDAAGAEVPGCVPSALAEKIIAGCERFMESCGYKGILAIELFVRGNGFVFNEMAPRPHNSGHYTIEGCTTSQYAELCHFLLGKPLQQPSLVAMTVMKNILGQDLDAAWQVVREAESEALAGTLAGHVYNGLKNEKGWSGEAGLGRFVHIYGKTELRPKRKMGHITFVPMTPFQYDTEWSARFV